MKLNRMREEMAASFLASLKEEKMPWQKEWSSMNGMPCNAINGSNYHGVNAFWLACKQMEKDYADPRWCTYNQAKTQGWQVKKGEKGVKVEFWSLYDTETKTKLTKQQTEELQNQLSREDFYHRIKPISNVYTVFNGEQIEGIPAYSVEKHTLDEQSLMEKRDVLLKNMEVGFQEGKEGASYHSKTDVIQMPDIDRFENEYAYMSTFLHEAGHATGHESRLNRKLGNGFGTPEYAKEELRAEIASAFTAQALGIDSRNQEHMDNHKAYVQSWIQVLEKNPEELFAAIRDAEKISDYLIEKGEFEVTEVKQIEKGKNQTAEAKEDPTPKKHFYTKEESKQMAAYLREHISILDVCSSLGYTPVRVGQNYYEFKEHDSVRLDIRRNCFFWNSTGDKGSVIDACEAFGNMSEAEAFQYLYDMAGSKEAVYEAVFGNNPNAVSYQPKTSIEKENSSKKVNAGEVQLPPKGASSRNVYAYLGKTRQISGEVISEFFKRDMLYQDDHNNCVFVGRDENGKPVFGCKRGTSTYKRFIADCEGNDYSKGFYVDNGADKLFVGESVIDVMSKMTMLREEGMDYHEYNYLALAGTQKQDPILNILESHPEIKEVVLGLDNDPGGLEAMEEISASLANRDIVLKQDIPIDEGQDWNDALRSYLDSKNTGEHCDVHQETYIESAAGRLDQQKDVIQPPESTQDPLIQSENSGKMDIEAIYQRMSEAEKEVYDMCMDFRDFESAQKMLKDKAQELQIVDNYNLINNIAEMEDNLDLPAEERLVQWSEQHEQYEPKEGIQGADLRDRWKMFETYHIPLLSTQEAARLRLIVKGRSLSGVAPDPEPLKVARQLKMYQDNGMDIQDVVSNKIGEIGEQFGIADLGYVKNLVCSIAAKNRDDYREYMKISSSHEKEKLEEGVQRKQTAISGKTNINISVNPERIDEIKKIIEKPSEEKKDLDIFTNPDQIETVKELIEKCNEQGIGVNVFADSQYTDQQMDALRNELLSGKPADQDRLDDIWDRSDNQDPDYTEKIFGHPQRNGDVLEKAAVKNHIMQRRAVEL